MIGQTLSHFRILDRIGSGGMGEVFKAEDVSLKRIVALKFLPSALTQDTDAKQRFIHEAQAASAIDHTNICTVFEFNEADDGRLFLSMPYYDGETLKERIARSPLAVEEVVDLSVQIARGLAKAHQAGIVHRDIKPANIMVTSDGVVKILDFGLAKLEGRTRLTKDQSTLGTAAYMSPEQARGEDVDSKTDMWSLGVVLYEMSTGILPFQGEYETAIIYSILNHQPKPPSDIRPDLPEALCNAMMRLLSKDAAVRYQDLNDLIAELLAIGSPNVRGKVSKARRKKQRKQLFGTFGLAIWLLVDIGLLSFLSYVIVYLWNDYESRYGFLNRHSQFTRELRVFEQEIESVDISRDGAWIVYSAIDKGRTNNLFVRSISSVNSRQLTFDSSYSPDGKMYFRGPANVEPSFFSDGSKIAYTKQRLVFAGIDTTSGGRMYDEQSDIFELDFREGATRLLVRNARLPKPAPQDQRMLFLRNSNIFMYDGQFQEEQELEATGLDAGYFHKRIDYAWNPSGRNIVYSMRRGPKGLEGVVLFDIAKKERRVINSILPDQLCWISEGGVITTGYYMDIGDRNLWRLSIDDGSLEQITYEAESCLSPRVSGSLVPATDERRLVYLRHRVQDIICTLEPGKDSRARQISDGGEHYYKPVFQPGSNKVAYGNDRMLVLFDLEGDNQRTIDLSSDNLLYRYRPTAIPRSFLFSSTGRSFVYGTREDIQIYDLQTNAQKKVGHGTVWGWSRDSERLIVTRDGFEMNEYAIVTIDTINMVNKHIRTVGPPPAFSWDSRCIVYLERNGFQEEELSTGKKRTMFMPSSYYLENESLLHMTGDGSIVYPREDNGPDHNTVVVISSADGRNERVVAELPGNVTYSISDDLKRIVYHKRQQVNTIILKEGVFQ